MGRVDPRGLQCEDGVGCWTTPEEQALAYQGDYAGYYGLACANGDEYACFARDIATNNGFWDGLMGYGTTLRLLNALRDAADRSKQCYDESKIMDQIRKDLAKSYADLLPSDRKNARWVSPDEVAQFHWNVFGQYGVPPSKFGGTPFGASYGPVLPWLWCPNCK